LPAAYNPRVSGESEFEHAVGLYAGHYAKLLDRHGPRLGGAGRPDGGMAQLSALARLRTELPNIIEALEITVQNGSAYTVETDERSRRLVAIARHLPRLGNMLSSFTVSQRANLQILDCARTIQHAELEFHAQLGLADTYWQLGDYGHCRSAAYAAFALADGLGDPVLKSYAALKVGDVEDIAGNQAVALPLYDEALAVGRAAGDRALETMTLNNLASIEYNAGRRAEAKRYFSEALELSRASGNRRGEALAEYNLGLVVSDEGCLAEAEDLLRRALASYQELGDDHDAGAALQRLAALHVKQSETARARTLFTEALELSRKLGVGQDEGFALLGLGDVEHLEGNLDAASNCQLRALDLFREQEDRFGEYWAQDNLGLTDCRRGDFGAAGQHFAASLAGLIGIAHERAYPALCVSAAAALAGVGQLREAAIALHAGVLHLTAHGSSLSIAEQQATNSARAMLEAAVTSGKLTQAEYVELQDAAKALTLNELAMLTLVALQD
jgi:tetratricopeptide (TPR) repeat protein